MLLWHRFKRRGRGDGASSPHVYQPRQGHVQFRDDTGSKKSLQDEGSEPSRPPTQDDQNTEPLAKNEDQSILGSDPADDMLQEGDPDDTKGGCEDFGMFILVDKEQNEEGCADIIALHGLNGHYWNTWTATSKSGKTYNWLADLPSKIPKARVMSYGYNSAVQLSKSTASIGDFADSLLEELISWRRSSVEKERPVIFICHSLGGIVFKQALIRARERDRYEELLKKIRGVAFFGTPHRGSSVATWTVTFAEVLRACSFNTSTNSKLLENLQDRSTVLEQITKSFVDRSKALLIQTFYESDKMAFMPSKVVNAESAVLNLPNETVIMINGNHRTICRFLDTKKDAIRYRPVWTSLQTMVDELLSTKVNYITRLSESEQRECIRLFYRSDYESFRSRNPNRVPGTCEWFLKHPQYLHWRNAQASTLLWVSADAGCGKSVLAKFLVDHLRGSKSKAGIPELVCHFFFKDDSEEQRNSILALNAVIHQITTDDQALLRHAFHAYETKGPVIIQEFGTLWNILMGIVKDPEATNIICILDGLDECESESQIQLLRSLGTLYASEKKRLGRKPFIKFVLFSRPENVVKVHFECLPEIRLRGEDETEEISKDVELVVQHSISKLKIQGLPQNQLMGLQNKLVEGPDRTFLWTTLVIQLLQDASTDGVSMRQLQALLETRDIYAIYDHLLEKSSDGNEKVERRKLLQIILAAARPLTLDEINIAMAISPSHKSFDDVGYDLKHPCENYVKSLCGHFVRVIRKTVYLVHQTAREFLLRPESHPEGHDSAPTTTWDLTPSTSQSRHWQHSFSMHDAEGVLLSSCILYLLLLEIEQKHPWTIFGSHPPPVWGLNMHREYCHAEPFFEYAATYWTGHFKAVVKQLDDKLILSGLRLCDPQFSGYSIWPNAIYKMKTPHQGHRLDMYKKQLKIAVRLDIEQLVLRLLQEPKIDPTMDERGAYQKALHLAAAVGSAKVVLLVLQHGADTEARDTHMRTALHIAVEKGSEETVQILLDHKADVEAMDSELVRPLHIAAANNSIPLVKLLLKFNANPDVKDRKQRTPLLAASAASGGSSAIVQLLLNEHVDVNAKNDKSRTALHLAADNADLNALTTLLAAKADVTVRDHRGDTPLKVLRRRPTLDASGLSGIWFNNCDGEDADDNDNDDSDDDER